MEKHASTTHIGFWKRFLAYYIDSLLLTFVGFGIGASGVGGDYVWAPSLLVSGAYFVFFWVKQDGQTLGNKLLAIKVVREDGKPLDVATAVIRYIGYIISGFVLNLGFLWVIWDKKKQGWHDKMAKTVVVKTDGKSHTGIAIAIVAVTFLLFILLVIGLVAGAMVFFKYAKENPDKVQYNKELQYQQDTTISQPTY